MYCDKGTPFQPERGHCHISVQLGLEILNVEYSTVSIPLM